MDDAESGDGPELATDEIVCFVIGPIGDKLSDAGTEARRSYEQAILTLENVIEPACYEAGITDPIRADKFTIAGEIPEQVFRLLRDADIVIADLTNANPNVMYELGLRHSRNKLTLQVGEKQRLPFDVQTIRTVMFKRSEGGYIDAKNTLRDLIEQGLTGSYNPVTATRIWNERTDEGPDDTWGPSGGQPPSPRPTEGGPGVAKQLDHAAQARDWEPEDEGPPGYIELLAELEEAMPRVNETLRELARITEEFGDIARLGTDEVEESNARGAGARGKLVIAIRFAERLDDPIDRYEQAASRLRADAALVDRGLAHIFEVVRAGSYEQDEIDEIKSGLTSMVGAREAYAGMRPSTEQFRDSMAGLARIARPVRTRVNRLARTVDQVLETLSAYERWGDEAEELLALVDGRAAGATPAEDGPPAQS